MNDDQISRQAVIDLWEKYHPTIAVDAMQYDAELRQLPPAQPEHATCYLDSPCEYQNKNIALPYAQPKVIHCKDCKYYLEGSDGLKYCYKHDDDILWFDDDFCSKAERMMKGER